VPGWTHGNIVDGDLYSETTGIKNAVQFFVNAEPVPFTQENGYAVISRRWKKDDVITFEYRMPVLKIASRKELVYDNDRIALQRGPLVYCVEGADNNGKVWNIVLNQNKTFNTIEYDVLEEAVIAIQTKATVIQPSADGNTLQSSTKTITAIPYYTWCNRGKNEMQVWLPVKMKEIKVNY
jgi:DUF1680 family protein